MSAFVMLFTMNSLKMNADTLERTPMCGIEEHVHTLACYPLYCGQEESDPIYDTQSVYIGAFAVHQHTADCYDDDGNLACGYIEGEYWHTHNRFCYDESGKLVCGLKERKPHEHTEACYEDVATLACGLEEFPAHVHTEDCYSERRELTCGLEETSGHKHTEDCIVEYDKLTCGKKESEGHKHSKDCYTKKKVLTCELEENPGHQHTDECYVEFTEVVCDKVESEGHKHTEDCYREELICGQIEGEDHEHTAECYGMVLVCGMEEGEGAHKHTEDCFHTSLVLGCGLEEGEGAHEHDDDCYTTVKELTCGKKEGQGAHTHSEKCYTHVKEIVCGMEKGEGAHKHTDDCYTTYMDLTCGQLETEGHTHTEDCYVHSLELTCGKDEGERLAEKLGVAELHVHYHTPECFTTVTRVVDGEERTLRFATCGCLEVQNFVSSENDWVEVPVLIAAGHKHTEACYDQSVEPICGLEEHVHSDACYQERPVAPVYTAGSATETVGDSVVTLSWGEDAALTEDMRAQVTEITRDDATYDALYSQALAVLPPAGEAVTRAMRFFDIAIYNKEETLAPQAPVSVDIRLGEASVSEIIALRFDGSEAVALDAANGNGVTFDTDALGVYGVAYGIPAETVDNSVSVTVDLSSVDLMDAATVSEAGVTLSITDLIDGADSAVDVDGSLDVDAANFVRNAEITAADVQIDNGLITLSEDALESGAVSLQLQTEEVSDDYVTTVTTQTVAIELTGYAGRVKAIDQDDITVTTLGDNSLPADAKATVEENLAVPEGIVNEGESAAAFDITITNENGDVISETGAVEVTVNPSELNVLADLPEGANPTGITYQLVHIHEGEEPRVIPLSQDAVVLDEQGNVQSITFETNGFSTYVLKYVVDYEVVNDTGVIGLDFTGFEPYPAEGDNLFLYDSQACQVRVSVEALLAAARTATEGGDGVALEGEVENFTIDLDNLTVSHGEGGVEYAEGMLTITADGAIELTDGAANLHINITGITALSEEILEADGVRIEVVKGNVPLGSEPQYTAYTDEQTAELVDKYIANTDEVTFEEGEEEAQLPTPVLGYNAADLKIVLGDQEVKAEGEFKVTVDKASLVPLGMKLEKLYHIHDGEVEELTATETEDGLEFTTTGFSDIVAGYTVDFEYNGYTWSFPGLGSYSLASILEEIELTGEIDDASLLLIEGEEVEGALYLTQEEDGWYLNSDAPFDEVYRLTIVVDGQPHIITVTDGENTWPVTVNLYDYNGTSPAISGLDVVASKTYCIMAVITDKNTGLIAGYRPSGVKFENGYTVATGEVGKSYKVLNYDATSSSYSDANYYADFDSNTQQVSFRLFEGTIATDQWLYQSYATITALPDSMTGFQFLPDPNGNIFDGNAVTMNLKRAYDKQYNIRFNIEPAGMGIAAEDEYYAFVTVEHATTVNTYGWTKIVIPEGQTTADFPIKSWYDGNGNVLPNEKFTGNEKVTVQLYTTNKNSDGIKVGFSDFNSFKNNQVKVLVAEGSSINKYNLYYNNVRTESSDDENKVTNYYDNLTLRAPSGNISKGDIDALLEDATDFGYYTLKYIGHSGDIEATIGAAYMDTEFKANFGYSSANVNVNHLKVLKIYTDSNGEPVSKEVTIHLKQNNEVVATQTGTTNSEGKLELEFDGLNSGIYEIEEVIDGQVVSGSGSAQVQGQTIYSNFSINEAHFANNKNVNYFGKLGDGQDIEMLKTMLEKSSRVDVVILTDTEEDKDRIEKAQNAKNYGTNIDVVLNGTEGYKHYDIESDMMKLKQLSDDLANAKSSSTVRIIDIKASEISENGLYFDDDGRYIVLNIEMDKDTFCPMVYLDGQLLESDYGQSGKSNSSHVLYNLRKDGTYYNGLVNTSKQGAGVILAPAANAHILGGPFGGTIITERVDREGNELHSNNPNQIQVLNAVIQNTIGEPTTGSLELRKEFANSSIKDKITYFTFEVQLKNADMTKVADKSFPASGLKKGDTVTFDKNGKAQMLVRAANSVTIANLPEGTTYTVKEITTPETEHFTLDHYEVNDVRGSSGEIKAGETSKAKVLNNLKKADLTIEKEVAGTTDETKEFEFTLKLENQTSGEGETAVWEAYPDKYKISVAGGEYEEVDGSKNSTYTFKLKAGEKAELQDLVVDNRVIRYTVTETAVYINGEGYEITPTNQPVYGYSNSELVIQNNYTEGDHLVFTNKYSADTKVRLVAHKVMQGRDLAADEFSFELRENSPTGQVVGTAVSNAADGTVTFGEIEYKIEHRPNEPVSDSMFGATEKFDGTREKVFTYYICEVVPENADPGIAYAEPIEVQVKVVDDGLGNLRAYDEEGKLITVYDNEGKLTSYTYTLPEAKNIVNSLKAEQTLTGEKTLTGRDMAEGEFTFNAVLTAINGEEVSDLTAVTGVNPTTVDGTNMAATAVDNKGTLTANGSITFPAITFTEAGIYTFTVTEDTTKLPNGVSAADPAQSFTATVTVERQDVDGQQKLVATTVYSEPMAFVNTWEGEKTKVEVNKEWYLRKLDGSVEATSGGSKEFQLYQTTEEIAESGSGGGTISIVRMSEKDDQFVFANDSIVNCSVGDELEITVTGDNIRGFYTKKNGTEDIIYQGSTSGSWHNSTGSIILTVPENTDSLAIGVSTYNDGTRTVTVKKLSGNNGSGSSSGAYTPAQVEALGGDPYGETFTVTPGETKTINNLPKVDASGAEYHYYVVESGASDTEYVYAVETEGEGENATTKGVWTVKNYITESDDVSVKVKKEWNGEAGDVATLYLLRYTQAGSNVDPEPSTDPTETPTNTLTVNVTVDGWVYSDGTTVVQNPPTGGWVWAGISDASWQNVSDSSANGNLNLSGTTTYTASNVDTSATYHLSGGTYEEMVDGAKVTKGQIEYIEGSNTFQGDAGTVNIRAKIKLNESAPTQSSGGTEGSGQSTGTPVNLPLNGTSVTAGECEAGDGSLTTDTLKLTVPTDNNSYTVVIKNSYNNTLKTEENVSNGSILTISWSRQKQKQIPCSATVSGDTITITVSDEWTQLNATSISVVTQSSSASALSPFQLAFNPFVAYADEGAPVVGDVDASKVATTGINTEGFTLDGTFGKVVTLSSGHWEETFSGLPVRDANGNLYYYAMVEAPDDNYTVSYSHDAPVSAAEIKSATGSMVTLKATNTPKTGSLKITKNVTINHQATTGTEADGTYHFIVKHDGTPINVGKVNGNDIANGEVTITITNGQSQTVTVTDLPVGSYTVEEDTSKNPAGMSLTGTNAQTLKVSGDSAQVQTASYTNDKTLGSLTVSKQVLYNGTEVTGDDWTPAAWSFPFILKDSQGNQVGEQHTVAGGGSVTIDNLPYGTYTIVELNEDKTESSGGKVTRGTYTFTVNKGEQVKVEINQPTNTATLTNDYRKDGKITVTKKVVVNATEPEEGTFYVALFQVDGDTETYLGYKTVLGGHTVDFDKDDGVSVGNTYRVYELSAAPTGETPEAIAADATEKKLAQGDKFDAKEYVVAYDGNQEVSLTYADPEKSTTITNSREQTDYYVQKRWMTAGIAHWNMTYDGGTVYFKLYRTVNGVTYPVNEKGERIAENADPFQLTFEGSTGTAPSDNTITIAPDGREYTVHKGDTLHYWQAFTNLPGQHSEYHAVETNRDGTVLYGNPANGEPLDEYSFYATCSEFGGQALALKNKLVKVEVKKQWSGNMYAGYSIELQLTQDDKALGDPVTVMVENGDVLHTWADLPMADPATGEKYVYSVEEIGVYAPDSDVNLIDSFHCDLTWGEGHANTQEPLVDTWTATLTNTEVTSVTATKQWKDYLGNDLNPATENVDKIYLRLQRYKADGETAAPFDAEHPDGLDVTLNGTEAEAWTQTWNNLTKYYEENGNWYEYKFKVTEWRISYKDDTTIDLENGADASGRWNVAHDQNGNDWTVTNTLNRRSISFTKEWYGVASETKLETWPTHRDAQGVEEFVPITVTVKRRLVYSEPTDGNPEATASTDQYDSFTATFENLLPNTTSMTVTTDEGNLTLTRAAGNDFTFIVSGLHDSGTMKDKTGNWEYHIQEAEVGGYSTKYFAKNGEELNNADSTVDGGTIRNTIIAVTLPATGGMGTTGIYLAGASLLILAILGFVLSSRKRWQGEGID